MRKVIPLYILQQFVNGICQGSIYALIAIGYTLIYGVVGLVSFNYGETVMIGAFSAYYAFLLTNNLFIGILFGMSCAAFLGIFIYKLCYERFLNCPPHISMICTIGFSMLVKNLAQVIFGTNNKALPADLITNHQFIFGGIMINLLQLYIIGIVIVTCIVFTFLLNKTKVGTMLRATSQDRIASAMVGINVKRMSMFGCCIGCALAGIAGTLFGLYYTTINPTIGGSIGLKALTSTILGGLSSVAGSALGGATLGILENVGMAFVSTGLRDAITFTALVIVLIFRPQGLYVRRRTTKC